MTAPIVHGGGITEAAAAFGGKPEDWLDLSTGINPNPVRLPDIDVQAWHRLPDRHLVDSARHAAARYYRSSDILPLPVPGTQSVIQLLPRLVAPGRRIAIFAPTYGEYARAFASAGFRDRRGFVSRSADAGSWTGDPGQSQQSDRTRLCVPRMSSAWRSACRLHGGLLLVDEAFGDTAPHLSVAGQTAGHGNLIVFRSFGKFFGLAGLRLGFVIAPELVLSAFQEWLGPWAVSGPALVVAAKLMGEDTQAVQSLILSRSEGLGAVLRQAGLTIIGGTPLFTLVDHARAADLHAHLCQQRVLTRKFAYAPSWLRIGLAPDAAGDTRLADALRSAHLV